MSRDHIRDSYDVMTGRASVDDDVRKSDLIDVTVILKRENDKAIAVVERDDKDVKWIWLPKSLIEIERKSAAIVEVTLPEWLAKKTGLI
jgi:hypothetical protein